MLRLRHCLPGPSAIRVLSSAVASGSDKAGAETSEGGSSQQGGRLPRVTIQPAIKRNPTDLLQALSDTVGVDPTAPHFAFIDDPAMIPSTAAAKRHYYMAKELGKRAARQLAEEWPTLFMFDRDYPRLSAFRPEQQPDPLQVDPTEENLLKMVEQREVKDAVMLYERMRSENKDVSDSAQLALFKLVAYYNGENVPFAEWEEWHGLRNYGESKYNEWTNAGIADLLYETLPKTAETTSILVAGMCKFASAESVQRAENLIKEMLEKNQVPHVEAFNGLIAKGDHGQWTWALAQMKNVKVKPNIGTWNALLSANTKLQSNSERKSHLAKLLNEMIALGVEPSLTSYNIVLEGIIDTREQVAGGTHGGMTREEQDQLEDALSWMVEIVSRLESLPQLTIQSPECNHFFLTAMVYASRASNLPLAERLVALYESEKNLVKMPAFTVENQFYTRYLRLYIERTHSINDIEEKYKELVPRLVGVTKTLTREMCEKVRNAPKWSCIRRVIEDGINSRAMTDHKQSSIFRKILLDVSFLNLSISEREEYKNLVKKLVGAWVELSRFTEENTKRLQIKMFPATVSECALMLHRIGESDRAYEMLETLLDEEAKYGETATITDQGQVFSSANYKYSKF
ncbi:hypothetical protein WR25_23958 isoform D [Diploscapter pachys]|uniref:Small ribosomal subunit protein mS39 n=1 Tax=Diploscapter pachys TaxID=2018661 RepID=A0A2A2LA64_9BILA|nr:hypothetical protein WR25_23958 isoform A [Diploscapter pachys]PAV83149.1 hypothetical protein WR25_23958 isoform D [Diploscapter pachys]